MPANDAQRIRRKITNDRGYFPIPVWSISARDRARSLLIGANGRHVFSSINMDFYDMPDGSRVWINRQVPTREYYLRDNIGTVSAHVIRRDNAHTNAVLQSM